MGQSSGVPLSGRDRRRAIIDRATSMVVTSSGLLVLLTLMLIFVYLLYAVLPLFKPASISLQGQFPLNHHAPTLTMGTDTHGQLAWRIDAQGNGQFIRLHAEGDQPAGSPVFSQALSAAPVSLSQAVGEPELQALGLSNGRLILVEPVFAGGAHWRFPLGDQPRILDDKQRPLRHIAVAEPQSQRFTLAAATDDGRLLIGHFADGESQVMALANPPTTIDQLLLTPDGRLLYLLSSTQLYIYQLNTSSSLGAPVLREIVPLAPQGPLHLTLLAGGKSLLVQSPQGSFSQWFDVQGGVNSKDNQPHLTLIRQFPSAAGLPLTENHRRVFASLTQQGELTLFSSIQSSPLLSKTVTSAVKHAAFAPAGNALLLENAVGWAYYRVNNAYPDINWHSLWQRVWYENYPEPAYVWQSTGADDHYQPKFSLVPIIFGTLKAAGYAMLFAVPLALAGAIYTAYFMSAALRRVIKPAIEVMGALPTVVIGLVAGIWLAPVIERYLAGILLLPVLLALIILLCGWGGAKLAGRMNGRLSAGWDVIILLPVIVVTVWLALRLGPQLALWTLGLPLHEWLGDDYDQRNALVVGVAMGFALIPIIFSLAEDALFSVPPSLTQGALALGATPWQTVVSVVLPSAFAGIFSALMIGFGRAVGETMIVLMATGNTPIIDGSLFQGLRALAANIAIEMPEAVVGSGHYRVLFLTALVLFVFTFLVNTVAEAIRLRLRERYQMERDA